MVVCTSLAICCTRVRGAPVPVFRVGLEAELWTGTAVQANLALALMPARVPAPTLTVVPATNVLSTVPVPVLRRVVPLIAPCGR